MSRLRYVKGNITEITGGTRKIFAKEGYEVHSNAQIINNAKGGKKHSEPDSPPIGPKPEIKPKCLVYFRPHNNYDGEYGFDWLRTGDTKKKGDTWFGSIMGRYFESDNTTVFQNANKWNNNFKKELKMYDRILRNYTLFNIPWKQKKGKNTFIYPTPIITLLEGNSALFNLKVEIEELPKKLMLEFKDKDATKYLSLNIQQISDLSKGKHTKTNYLKITCNKAFDTMQTLYIKADGEICGAIKIHPNSTNFQKKINVVFINVWTDINGVDIKGKSINGGKDFFKKCLNQALVIPNLTTESQYLDCTGSLLWNTFKHKFCTYGMIAKNKNGYKVTDNAGLREYLEEQLQDQFGDKYKGYYTVFFVGEKANWNGFSFFNSRFGVYFDGHNRGTLAHELMHAMTLAHTFDGVSPSAKFTYEATKTDNIMDYSHLAKPPIDRKVIYHWQWKILNPKIL